MATLGLTRLPRPLSRRFFTTSSPRHASTPFKSTPAPPRLPKEDQELFERLQKQSTGAFSTPRTEPGTTSPQVNQSPSSTSSAHSLRPQVNQSPQIRSENGQQIRQGEDLHPNMRRGAPPEFEGERNPQTGEVGGPKNEPLRWGVGGDWSYNGRVTDF